MAVKSYRTRQQRYDVVSADREMYVRGGYATSRTVVRVRTANDMPEYPDGDVAYLIDGVVDFTESEKTIRIPETGLQLSGNGTDLSKMICSADNYTMFQGNGTYAGNFFVGGVGLSIEVTGTNSKVFDLDNQENSGAVEFRNLNFNSCTSLGTLSNYRQLLGTNIAWFNCTDGLTMDGVWSGGGRVTTSITILQPSSCTLFKAGGSLDIQGGFTSDLNALSVDAASTIFDFAEANFSSDRGFKLGNFRTTATNPIPNISSSSDKAYFTKCEGVANTYPGGSWTLTSAAATALSGVASGTFLKAAGTTTYSGLAWFNGDVDNAFELNINAPIDILVLSTVSMSGTNGDQIILKLRQWDDSAGSYVDVRTLPAVTMNSGGRAENIAFPAIVTVDQNDRIELWVANNTAARDITLLLNSTMEISERSS